MKLVAVDGRGWTKERVEAALLAHKTDGKPFELLAANNDFYRTYSVDYHGGAMNPHLVRDGGGPDLLAVLIRPLAKRETSGKKK
jgi:hypothetical protein